MLLAGKNIKKMSEIERYSCNDLYYNQIRK